MKIGDLIRLTTAGHEWLARYKYQIQGNPYGYFHIVEINGNEIKTDYTFSSRPLCLYLDKPEYYEAICVGDTFIFHEDGKRRFTESGCSIVGEDGFDTVLEVTEIIGDHIKFNASFDNGNDAWQAQISWQQIDSYLKKYKAPKLEVCLCDIMVLLQSGCQCGQIERERHVGNT